MPAPPASTLVAQAVSPALCLAAERVARGTPLRAQVFAHIQGAGHPVALQFSGKAIGERGAVYFTDCARDAHVAPRDRPGAIARHEIALMRSHNLVALLLHVQGVVGSAGSEFDVYVPSAGEIARRRLRRLGLPRRPLRREDLKDPVAY